MKAIKLSTFFTALAFILTSAVALVKAEPLNLVGTINSVNVSPREFNGSPTSTLTIQNNFPTSISISDQSVNGAVGEANRHVFRFSGDGGATPLKLTNDSFFDVTMNVMLQGPSAEAGFLLDTLGGQGQFIVKTDTHEVVAFGGPLPFYTFPSSFNSGDSIQLGMKYFLDSDGTRKIIFAADGMMSPALAFTNLEQGIIEGSTLGGYLQVNIMGNNPDNGATAEFGDIDVEPVPEPTTMLLLGTGLAGIGGMIKKRRQGKEK